MWNISGIRTFTAGEALAARRLVKVDTSSTTDPPEVEYADAGEDAIGITEYAAANGAMVAVKLLNTTGTFEVEVAVNSSIGRGTLLYAANDGKASDASSGSPLGVALETGVTGALIEMAYDYRKSTTAAGTTIADAGTFTSEANVEGALQEIYGFLLAQEIDDPGDAGAIPVTKTGVCPITSTEGGGETRTLAIPARVGQQITLTLDVDGGDVVVTVAAAVNVTGNNTLTLDNAGETITLIGTEVGGAKVWRVLANDGVGLSTV